MKFIFCCFMFFCLSKIGFAQQKRSVAIPSATAQSEQEKLANPLVFKETKHDFGKIKKGVPVTYDFAFTNTSNKSVAIESANVQCGCTTPVYPLGAIAKGASDKVSVTFNAANAGTFMKQVTLKIAGNSAPIYLVLSGEVLPLSPNKQK